MVKKEKERNFVKEIVSTGVTNMIGVGMIGATAGMVNELPAGTAKNIAGMVPAFQSTALLGPNIKLMKSSLSEKSSKKGKSIW